MFKQAQEASVQIRSNVRDGNGDLVFRHLLTPEEVGGRMELFAEITLEPGQSIGVHPHDANAEAYFIHEGSVTVTDDGESRILTVGDAQFCSDGHTHSILNHTDKTAKFLAVIVPNR